MKKLLVCFLAAIFAITACSKDEGLNKNAKDEQRQEITITASQINESTKTIREADGKVFWKPGDEINVFFKSDEAKFTSTNTEDAATVAFNGSLTISSIIGMTEGSDDDNCLWGLYPYDSDATFDGHSIITTLSNNQTGVAGTFADDLFITLARNNSFDLAFYNVLSGFKFTVTRDDISSIVFSGNNGETLTGKLKLAFGEDCKPCVQSISEGQTSITLTPENGTFEIGKSYYFVFVPTNFTKGFTVTMTTTSDKEGTFVYEKSVEFSRNVFKNRSGLDANVEKWEMKLIEYIDEYGINHGCGIRIDDGIWAPVNCGYQAAVAGTAGSLYGKLYQWGRKYGQDYKNNETLFPEFCAGPAEIEEAENPRNSSVFYYITLGSQYDYWEFISKRDNTLWNVGTETDPIKTIYDPCPKGWRVPTHEELFSLFEHHSSLIRGDINGIYVSGSKPYDEVASSIFIPAAGARRADGVPINRNTLVYCWSSSFSDGVIYNNGEVKTISHNCSGYAHSLRCIQETEHDEHSLDIAQTSAKIQANEFSTKVEILGSDVAWVATCDNEDYVIEPASGIGASTIKIICFSSASSSATVTIKTNALRMSTNNEYKIAVMRTSNPKSQYYVDENGINQGEGIVIDGIVWAPVNCGYIKPTNNDKGYGTGLFFQWGRKYGQGNPNGTDRTVPVIQNGPASLIDGQNQSNANVFYLSTGGNEWTNEILPSFWNGGTTTVPYKSEYDPCPNGWRIPTKTEVQKLIYHYKLGSKNGKLGYIFSGGNEYSSLLPFVFFPATNEISGSTGQSVEGEDVIHGLYWTSNYADSKKGPVSSYMSFGSYSSGVPHISDSSIFSSGFKLRCVHE